MEHRRLMSKLLTTKRLAIKTFCADQSQEAGQRICGVMIYKRSTKER